MSDCGFWIASPYGNKNEPDEWWECVIADEEHMGRDHLLARQIRVTPTEEEATAGSLLRRPRVYLSEDDLLLGYGLLTILSCAKALIFSENDPRPVLTRLPAVVGSR